MTHSEHTAASSKAPLAPDLRRMDDRSARAWTEAMAVEPLGDDRYRVESESGNAYEVDLPRGDCTCPDHGYRGERCKHLRRVAIEVNRGLVPPPGTVAGECGACGREAFVPENEQPALCPNCHLERGDVATDRETGDLVVVVRVTDQRADERVVEATGTTVAAHPTNEGYPADDLVVEAVYPFSGPTTAFEDRPRYAFPRSRLARRDEQLLGLGR